MESSVEQIIVLLLNHMSINRRKTAANVIGWENVTSPTLEMKNERV